MFNDKKIQEVRLKIQESTILTDHEKGEWLNLIELMNDKQLGELETILGQSSAVMHQPSTSPATQSPSTATQHISAPTQNSSTTDNVVSQNQHNVNPGTQGKMPDLHHIANVPSDVSFTRSVPAGASLPKKTFSTPKGQTTPNVQAQAKIEEVHPARVEHSTQTQISPTLSRKPSENHSLPTQPSGAESSSASAHSLQPKQSGDASSHTGATMTQPVNQPLQQLQLVDVEEIKTLTTESLRKYDLESIVSNIRSAIEQIGYYKTLQLLENSALYKNYILTGKILLGSKAPEGFGSNQFSQNEFEFFTDLLVHMRVNSFS